MIKLSLPLTEQDVRELKVGDAVSISGKMVTGRDAAHVWLTKSFQDSVADLLAGSIIYHCGPVVSFENEQYSFVAAGPTTSIREEPYQADVMKTYGVRGVIGKGGMGKKTLEGLKESGGVYLHAIGGAASSIAQNVVKVLDVKMLDEFGVPEAIWVIEVEDFKAVVTMDSHGNSLHDKVKEKSKAIANQFISKGL